MDISEQRLKRIHTRFIVADNGCWNWMGVLNQDGYGRVCVNYRDYLAHRFMYELYIKVVDDGKELDHLCRNRKCVNPRHLEEVTHRENILRGDGPSAIHAKKTKCPYGHTFDRKNTRINSNGSRHCRMCDKIRHQNKRNQSAWDRAEAIKKAEEERRKRLLDKPKK